MKKCIDPKAPYVECVVCGTLIKTCERKTPVNGGDYTCPVHNNGVELYDGNWVCENCYYLYIDEEDDFERNKV